MSLKNQRKIIFVHFNNGYSGSPHVLRTVIDSIEYPSVLITNRAEGFLSDVKIPTTTFNFELSASKIATLFNYVIAQLNIFFIVLRKCKKNDLVYINTTVPVLAGCAGKIKGAQIVFHLHERVSSLNFIHRSMSSLRKYVCDVEIFVSDFLSKKEHVKNKISYVVYNVLPQSFVKEALKSKIQHKKNGFFNILMICSLKSYKGVFEFLKIAERFISFNDIKFTLLVGDDRNEIHRFFRGTEVPKNVVIHERTNNTIPFYDDASIVLNLSRPDGWVETYGLTILEGMTFGLPCIVPPVGGPIELIDEGINGYRISCYELDDLEKAIFSLFSDEDLYLTISKSNKEKASNYSFNVFKKEINSIIDETLRK